MISLKQMNVMPRIARRWIGLGAVILAFTVIMAIAHYYFGVPIHEAHTEADATPAEIATILSALAAGSLFFIIAGLAVLRWWPKG